MSIYGNNLDYKRKIDALRNEIKKLESDQVKFNSMPVEQRVTEYLHEEFCNQNHTDGCGYHYDDWNDGNLSKVQNTKRYWLDKAIRLLEGFSEEAIYIFVKAYKGK